VTTRSDNDNHAGDDVGEITDGPDLRRTEWETGNPITVPRSQNISIEPPSHPNLRQMAAVVVLLQFIHNWALEKENLLYSSW